MKLEDAAPTDEEVDALSFMDGRARQRRRGEPIRSDYMGMFPLIEDEDWWMALRQIVYSPSMTGGYGFTRRCFSEMDLDEIESHIVWLRDQRRREQPRKS